MRFISVIVCVLAFLTIGLTPLFGEETAQQPNAGAVGPLANSGIGALAGFEQEFRSSGESGHALIRRNYDSFKANGAGKILSKTGINLYGILMSIPVFSAWCMLLVFGMTIFWGKIQNPLAGGNKFDMMCEMGWKLFWIPLAVMVPFTYSIAESLRSTSTDFIYSVIVNPSAEIQSGNIIEAKPAVKDIFQNIDQTRAAFDEVRINAISRALDARSKAFTDPNAGIASIMAQRVFYRAVSNSRTEAQKKVPARYGFSYDDVNLTQNFAADENSPGTYLTPAQWREGDDALNKYVIPTVLKTLIVSGSQEFKYPDIPFEWGMDWVLLDPLPTKSEQSWRSIIPNLVAKGSQPGEAGYALSRIDNPRIEHLARYIDRSGAFELQEKFLNREVRRPEITTRRLQQFEDLVYNATLQHIDNVWLYRIANTDPDQTALMFLRNNLAEPHIRMELIQSTMDVPFSVMGVVGNLTGHGDPLGLTGIITGWIEKANAWLVTTLPRLMMIMFMLSMEIGLFLIFLTYPTWFIGMKAFTGWIQTTVTSILYCGIYAFFISLTEIMLALFFSALPGSSRGGYVAMNVGAGLFIFRLVFYIILAVMVPSITRKILNGQQFIGKMMAAAGMAAVAGGLAATGVGAAGLAAAKGATLAGGAIAAKTGAGAAVKGGLSAGASAIKSGKGISGAISAAKQGGSAAKTANKAAGGFGGQMKSSVGNAIRSAGKLATPRNAKALAAAAKNSTPGKIMTAAAKHAMYSAASGGDISTYARVRSEMSRNNHLRNMNMSNNPEKEDTASGATPNPAAR